MNSTAQTTAERQSLYRARRTIEGKTEVRGIYLLPEQHALLRALARDLNNPPKGQHRENDHE